MTQQTSCREMLNRIRCFVLDMDGTIYLGDQLFSFTSAFLQAARESGRDCYFFTNNSSKNAECYHQKLKHMGIPVEEGRILISNQVLIRRLQKEHAGKSVYVVGTSYLLEDFERAEIQLEEEHPDIVVLGFDTGLTYEKLEKACRFVRGGCLYYGVNPDFNCPVENGGYIPDCGSMARLIEASTGRLPEFFGKPSRCALDYIIEKTGYPESELAVIGDRLYTDIALTQGTDALSVLVLSGESTEEDAKNGAIQPDVIIPSLESLIPLLSSD